MLVSTVDPSISIGISISMSRIVIIIKPLAEMMVNSKHYSNIFSYDNNDNENDNNYNNYDSDNGNTMSLVIHHMMIHK